MSEASGAEISLHLLQQQNLFLQGEVTRLKSGGGGGTSDGMEPRVSRLEAHMDKLSGNVGDVKVSLATLTERVAHLPSKGFIIKALVTTIGILSGVVLLADRLKTLIG